MAEAGVLVGADDAPIAPVIAWHDHRDTEQLRDLVSELGGEQFSRRTGLPLWTQWSLTKHRWLIDHVPAARGAVRRYNIAEWVARSLGARPVTELSLASRTGWLDLATARPWAESMAWSGAPERLLGERPLGRRELRLERDDARGAGDELDSCGTAEAFVRTVAPGLDPTTIAVLTKAGVTVGWHVIDHRWSLLGATQGGLILGRVQAGLGVDRAGLAALDAAALSAADHPATLQVTDDADVVIAPGADPGQVWRAATRLVTAQAKALCDTLDRASGPRRELVVAGGWTNSAMLMAAKAAALGPLRTAVTTEAGARGAAFLAGLASGAYSSYADIPNGARPDEPTATAHPAVAAARRPNHHEDLK